MNLYSLIDHHARSRPNRVAIEFADARLSFRECRERTDALARGIHASGARTGDRVGLCLGDHPDHVLLHYALARLGICIVPLDHRWSAVEKRNASSAFGARLVVVDDGTAEIDGVTTTTPRALLRAPRNQAMPEMPDGPDLALVVSMSSGTTGRPKGALVTHDEMYQRFVTQWVTLGFNASDRFILVTPLYFGAGRSFSMAFLAAGATLVLFPPPYEPAALRNAIDTSAATATFLVPTMMRRLLELDGRAPMFPNLNRLLISGEAFYAAEVADFQARLTPNLIGYYASSEGGGITVLQPADFTAHPDSVGQAAFRVDVEIVDESDAAVAPGAIGRLRYRGPGVTLRLLDEGGTEQPRESSGWFYPGDLADIDGDGFVRLRGREKDMIIRGGVNIYPAEIEQALMSHAAVAEAAVIGVGSGSHGESVVACIAGEGDADDGELLDWCRQRLAPYKVPSRIVRLATLPKSAAGKIDKKALQAIAGSDES